MTFVLPISVSPAFYINIHMYLSNSCNVYFCKNIAELSGQLLFRMLTVLSRDSNGLWFGSLKSQKTNHPLKKPTLQENSLIVNTTFWGKKYE